MPSSVGVGLFTWAVLKSCKLASLLVMLALSWEDRTNSFKTAWWTYFEIMNILTDTCLVILPLGVVWGVQTSLSKKASVLAFFGGRIT